VGGVLLCRWLVVGGCACWLPEGGFVQDGVGVWRACPGARNVWWMGWVLLHLVGGCAGFRLLFRSGGV
jgi:hypothetical protein